MHWMHKLNCRNIATQTPSDIDQNSQVYSYKECFLFTSVVEVIFCPFSPSAGMWFVYNTMCQSQNHIIEQIVKAKFTFISYQFNTENTVPLIMYL